MVLRKSKKQKKKKKFKKKFKKFAMSKNTIIYRLENSSKNSFFFLKKR